MVNNLTNYVIFIADILKKDMVNIDKIFSNRLKEQLLYDGIFDHPEEILPAFKMNGLEFHASNNDRRIIGRINDFVSSFKIHCSYKYGHLKNMPVVYENYLLNTTPTGKPGELKKSWSSPKENMKEAIRYNRGGLIFSLN